MLASLRLIVTPAVLDTDSILWSGPSINQLWAGYSYRFSGTIAYLAVRVLLQIKGFMFLL